MFRLPRTPHRSATMRQLSALLSLVALLGGCSLPKNETAVPSFRLAPELSQNSRLHQVLQPVAEQHTGLSGIYSLADPFDAFAVRLQLAQAAETSLDIQYYIWRGDTSGFMLLEAIKEAADRGVRVRLLLDDNGTRNLDPLLAALNQHPNIQVRLFNPFVLRQPKSLGFLFDFERLNRRMHNKSFTVDNTITIVGGRNIGDEYFGVTDTLVFADLDVLALGAVVPEVAEDFDRYWNNALSFPIELILDRKSLQTSQDEASSLDFSSLLAQRPERYAIFTEVAQEVDWARALLDFDLPVEWVKTEMVSDDPDKAQGQVNADGMLTSQLNRAIGTPKATVDLISPYFVPTATGVFGFSALINEQDVQVRVLTNSYDATDVAIVHAGYSKQRKNLLRAGVELYELKKLDPAVPRRRSKRRPLGFSGSSLHAKTFAIDGERLFVGSFNFDPRSALLNTELGFVIHSPSLAQQVSALFDHEIPLVSYRVVLTDDQRLRWIDYPAKGATPIIHETEPKTNLLERFWLGFLSRLPIEWLL